MGVRLGRLRHAVKAAQTCEAAGEVEECATGEKCSVRLGRSARGAQALDGCRFK